MGKQTIKARKLWEEICVAQTETGMPYLLYKDACNAKSNQKHLGTLVTSNPCAEILQFCGPNEVILYFLGYFILIIMIEIWC